MVLPTEASANSHDMSEESAPPREFPEGRWRRAGLSAVFVRSSGFLPALPDWAAA